MKRSIKTKREEYTILSDYGGWNHFSRELSVFIYFDIFPFIYVDLYLTVIVQKKICIK